MLWFRTPPSRESTSETAEQELIVRTHVPMNLQLNNFATMWTLTSTVMAPNALKVVTCHSGLPCHYYRNSCFLQTHCHIPYTHPSSCSSLLSHSSLWSFAELTEAFSLLGGVQSQFCEDRDFCHYAVATRKHLLVCCSHCKWVDNLHRQQWASKLPQSCSLSLKPIQCIQVLRSVFIHHVDD